MNYVLPIDLLTNFTDRINSLVKSISSSYLSTIFFSLCKISLVILRIFVVEYALNIPTSSLPQYTNYTIGV